MICNSVPVELEVSRHSLKHWAEYGAYRLLGGGLSIAPEVIADRGGAALGWMIARGAPVRWDVVTGQLKRAFPDAEEAWIRDIARKSYAHLGAEAVAMLRLAGLGAAGVRSHTTVYGFDVLERAVAEGTGAVVVTGHLGNWEIGGASMACRGLPIDVIAARQRNLLFDRHLVGSRERLGMNVIYRGDARARALEALRKGHLVGILGDQDARQAGVFVDFFGSPASTARGPALFALRAKAPLVLGVVHRIPGHRPRYDVTFEEVVIERSGKLRDDITSLTQAFTSKLEAYIRKAPEQYFWLHKRWKTAPPETADGGSS